MNEWLEIMRDDLQTRLIEKTTQDWHVAIRWHDHMLVQFVTRCNDCLCQTRCLDIGHLVDEETISQIIRHFSYWEGLPQYERDEVNEIRAKHRSGHRA